MKNKMILVKAGIMAVMVLGIFGMNNKVNAEEVEENRAPVFQHISDSTIECYAPFSVLKNGSNSIKAYNFDGKVLNYSVYYRGKKVNSTDNYINRSKVGTHKLRYEVKGTDGQITNQYRTIKIVDKTKPVFKNLGNSTITINSKFSVKKNGKKTISAVDKVDGTRGYSVYLRGKKVSKSNYINTKKVGTYKLRYEVKDKSGNTRNVYRTIKVINPYKPYFTNLSNTTIAYNSKFSVLKNGNKSIKAYCKGQGQLKYSVYLKGKKVSKSNYINTKKSGKYILKYIAKNSSGKTTTKFRTITVKAKPVKTSIKKVSTSAKAGNTVHIYPKMDNQSGWWYSGYDKSRLYIHSGQAENMRSIKAGTTLKIHLNNTIYTYYVYDKALIWAPSYNYSGSSKAKEWRYVTRNRSALNDINNAPLYLQTCADFGYSKIMVSYAKPVGKAIPKQSSVQVFAPQ